MGFSWPNVKEIIMNEKENKKVTRRKFLEDSSKKALAGTAAAFLGLGMIKPKAVQAAGCVFSCSGGCSGSCEGCTGSCTGSCLGSCSDTCTMTCTGDCVDTCVAECMAGCTNTCEDSCTSACTSECSGACTGSCEGTCTVSGRSVSAAEAQHGTPVSEREASTRHVTV